jgi:hypothetical protein
MTDITEAMEPAKTVEQRIEEAVRPYRAEVRDMEGIARRAKIKIEEIRNALVDLFNESSFDSLNDRDAFNEFLSGLSLKTVPRIISGSVEVTLTARFTFEDIELEDGADVEDTVREWLEDEGHVDKYVWDVDSLEVDIDSDG